MPIKKYMLFYTPMCPNCPQIKDFMLQKSLEKEWVDASTQHGLDKAKALNVARVPTVIFFDEQEKEVARGNSLHEIKTVLERNGID